MTVSVQQFQAGFCFSYLLESNNEYVIIDPHITLIEQYRNKLQGKGPVKAIIDTHTHADHISSALVCSKEFAAPVFMSNKAQCTFAFDKVGSGDRITFGASALDVLAGPGHTDDSILLACEGHLFTGDVLLINSVGRCDFQNGSPESMYATLQEVKKKFADDTRVWPAHDYNGKEQSTLGAQKAENPFLADMSEEDFIALATAKEIPKPADMDAIIATNREGANVEIGRLSPEEAQEKLAGDDWVLVDVRTAEEYGSMHIEPSINIPMAQIGVRSDELVQMKKKILLTCRTGARASAVANALLGAGLSNINLLEGALVGWRKAGLPVERKGPRLSLLQQVHTIAGFLAVTGAVLALLVHPLWVLLCLVVGSGLLFAGLSGICLMGEILLRMPWNAIDVEKGQSTGGGCSLDSGGGCALPSGGQGGQENQGGGCSL